MNPNPQPFARYDLTRRVVYIAPQHGVAISANKPHGEMIVRHFVRAMNRYRFAYAFEYFTRPDPDAPPAAPEADRPEPISTTDAIPFGAAYPRVLRGEWAIETVPGGLFQRVSTPASSTLAQAVQYRATSYARHVRRARGVFLAIEYFSRYQTRVTLSLYVTHTYAPRTFVAHTAVDNN